MARELMPWLTLLSMLLRLDSGTLSGVRDQVLSKPWLSDGRAGGAGVTGEETKWVLGVATGGGAEVGADVWSVG